MPSTRSTVVSIAASRARVSRLPSPQSISRRVRSVSSNVRLPELPDARMDTRKPIVVSPEPAAAARSPQLNFNDDRRVYKLRQRLISILNDQFVDDRDRSILFHCPRLEFEHRYRRRCYREVIHLGLGKILV